MSASWRPIVALLTLTWSKVAGASAAEPLAVKYDAAPGCPSQDSLFADLVAQVHDASRAAGASFEVRIIAAASGFSGELVATDAEGDRARRRVDGRTCVEVAHALAFLAAVAVELGGRLEESSGPPGPMPPPSPQELPQGATLSLLQDAPMGRPWQVAFEALGEARGGLTPGPLLSTAIGLDVAREVTSVLSPSASVAIDGTTGHLDGAAGSAPLWMICGRVALCPLRFGGSTIGLRPCVDAELGAVHAAGQTPLNPHAVTEPWASVGTVLQARWLVERHFFIAAELAAELLLVRTRYFFEPNETLYLTPPAAGRGGLGLGLLL